MANRHVEPTRQFYAKVTGLLLLLSIVAGGFGEFYAPSKLIADSAAATANNLNAYQSLFRIGFASYLIEATCDVALTLLFYVLLKPVHKGLALLAAFFGLVSTATYAFAEVFDFMALHIVGGASYLQTFTPH